jgi:hypothetical protein
LNPTIPTTPLASTASRTASASARARPTGFSIHRCFPASATATPISRCKKLGAVTLTAAMLRVGEHRPPVLVHRDIAVGRGEGLRRARNRLGHGDDPRTQGQVRPMLDRAGIRPGMNVTHPAGADDGDGKFGDRHKHSWSGSRDDRLTGGHWHMF